MTKSQIRQEKAVASARIQAMISELEHLELLIRGLNNQLDGITARKIQVNQNIAAEKNFVKDL